MILGMTWTKTKRSALGMRFSTAHFTARRLPFPSPPLTATATATDVIIQPERFQMIRGWVCFGHSKLHLKFGALTDVIVVVLTSIIGPRKSHGSCTGNSLPLNRVIQKEQVVPGNTKKKIKKSRSNYQNKNWVKFYGIKSMRLKE